MPNKLTDLVKLFIDDAINVMHRGVGDDAFDNVGATFRHQKEANELIQLNPQQAQEFANASQNADDFLLFRITAYLFLRCVISAPQLTKSVGYL